MHWYIALPVYFVFAGAVWIIVLVLYNLVMEPFDFGALGTFALKSALLVLLVSLVVTFLPFGGMAAFLIWWVGLMVIFKKDIWECRTLVVMIWLVNFLVSIGLRALFAGR